MKPTASETAALRLLDVQAHAGALPLYGVAGSRAWEAAAAAGLPDHTLMARAGLAVAKLSLALAPHARRIWIACGPGNNGGDGFVAAAHLHRWFTARGLNQQVIASFHGQEAKLPEDAHWALDQMRASGLEISPPPVDGEWDFAVDALLGIGGDRVPGGTLQRPWEALRRSARPVLSVDIPSGLMTNTGAWPPGEIPETPPGAKRYTLSLLSLKPGLFTASGRDAAGTIWYDSLGTEPPGTIQPTAWLTGTSAPTRPTRVHASHKGSFGDVVIVGGQRPSASQAGMAGAALLAARAALHAGAGRVYVSPVGAGDSAGEIDWDPGCPELMFRHTEQITADTHFLGAPSTAVVCGCGGGDSVRRHLHSLISRSNKLVLDADALNAIAADESLQTLLAQRRQHSMRATVLTPHPLEAARLLGVSTAQVQSDRLAAAMEMSNRFGAVVALKGSGSIIVEPDGTPWINRSGNAQLASAGTGDVLAGMIGAALAPTAQPAQTLPAVRQAVWRHGHLADQWPEHGPRLTASALAVQAS